MFVSVSAFQRSKFNAVCTNILEFIRLAFRVRCGTLSKAVCTGEPEDPVEGLELTVLSCANPHQEAKGPLIEGLMVNARRLKDLCQRLESLYWKPRDAIQGEDEDQSSSEEMKASSPFLFAFYNILVTSFLWMGLLSFTKSPQLYPKL